MSGQYYEWLSEPVVKMLRSPKAYLGRDDFDCRAAFINGYDTAMGLSLLQGFREWLSTRLTRGYEFTWDGLVLMSAMPTIRPGSPRSAEDDRLACEELHRLLTEFFALRREPDSLRKIFRRFEEDRNLARHLCELFDTYDNLDGSRCS